MLKHVRAAACAAGIGVMSVAGTGASAATFMPSQFVIFGDSFIDAGSVNRFSGGTLAPASTGFWHGRWSDGPTWIDYLGYANFGTPTKAFNAGVGAGQLPPPFQLGATNFAIGGARASGDDVQEAGTIPGLLNQFAFYQGYLALTRQTVDPDALYVLNFGNNDVTLIEEIKADPRLSDEQELRMVADVQSAYVGTMRGVALALASAGANNILIGGVPNPLEQDGRDLQALLNFGLADYADEFTLLGANVQQFDYFAFFTSLRADPTQFGLPATLDFDNACLDKEAPGPNVDCGNYLSFDGIHVTTGVQRAISIQVANQLGIAAVPEPASWALMITGFGLVGGMARRNRARQTA